MADLSQLNIRPEHFRPEDKTNAMLVYMAGLVGIMLVSMDDKKKNNPVLRFHMIQAIGLLVVMMILSFLTCGVGSLIYLPMIIIYGLKASKGELFEIPVITNYLMDKGHFDPIKELTAGGMAPPAQGGFPPAGAPPQGPPPGDWQ